ncbi:MAG TPA: NADH-quinone oxidoreductase subunit NuoH [Aggregatilineales bacterium]|nr:NADH-quinone oxidoreductase subunit NuoH [Anaerolineales bacterium]HRE47152.1 NADH-quinone oxidoreductase subunit NuoH [Aggregatilineales bacterium]
MVQTLIDLGWNKDAAFFVASLLGVIVCASFGLVWILFSIWLERKVAGRIQDRVGPNRTGPYGLFQSFADLGKLITKEDITPANADRHVYNIAPLLAVASVIMIFAVVPFSASWIGADLNIGVLYFIAVASLGTLAIMLAGWGSNNKYSLLGAFRVIAALISYEVPTILALVVPVMLAGTMSMQGIVHGQTIAYIFVAPVSAFIFFVSQLAEAGRSPFDLMEAESEIIAGYNIEYTGMKFGMFMASEFIHGFVICVLTVILFMGGWQFLGTGQPGSEVFGFMVMMGKSVLVYFLVMLIRATMPRFRIDHMMAFNWKFLVPLALANIIIIALLGKLFVPDYAAARAAVEAGGLAGILGGVLGAGFLAELPRAVVCLIGNIALWIVASNALKNYATTEQTHIRSLIAERKLDRKPSTAVEPAAGD